jgi:hypothetical protein
MAQLRKKDRWRQAMIDSVSLAKAAKRCGVHPTTAYRWRHRLLSAPTLDQPQPLQGIVEGNLHPRIVQGPALRSGARAHGPDRLLRPALAVLSWSARRATFDQARAWQRAGRETHG